MSDRNGMNALRFEGYVIVSADGMLADASGAMPDVLKFPGDQAFFNAAMDRADLIVHGRNSFEDQPNSPQRRRVIVTRGVAGIASDPGNPNATLWNPAGAALNDAIAHAGVGSGRVAVIGGPAIFAIFADRYDVFWLSVAPHVRIPEGQPCFPGVGPRSAEEVLASWGLQPGDQEVLDAAHDVRVTAWRRG